MSEFCSIHKKCGSCQLSNLSYTEQLKFKEKKCKRLYSGICPVSPITPSPLTQRYRNKAQFVFQKRGKAGIVSGVYQSATRSVIPTVRCALCSDTANRIAAALCRLLHSFKIAPYNPYRGAGWLKSVLIREAQATGEVMVILNGADAVFPAKRTFATALQKACPEVTTAIVAVNRDPRRLFTGKVSEVLFGDGWLTDILCEKRFRLSATAFYQVNRLQTEQLYQKALDLLELKGDEVLLDAYCGIGTVGIIAADRVKRVLCVELNPEAIRDARRNAALNGIENISFIAADSRDYARGLAEQGERIDAAVIDPPRAGCTASFLKALSRLEPERIVYISCDPQTQARDVKVLARLGYRAQCCHPYDMFPHTGHVESIVLINKSD